MRRFLAISALVHAVLLLVLPALPGLGRDESMGLEYYAVELVEIPAPAPARVEEPVAEPAEAEPEEPVSEPEPELEPQIPEERPRRRVAPKKPQRQVKSLEERLQERLEGKDDQRRSEEREAPDSNVEAQTATATAKVSATRFPYGWYLSVIQGKVSSNWRQPSSRLLGEDSFLTVVSFRIRRNGSIDVVTVRRSSGRPTVDQSAIKAVRDSSPFPELPNDYMEDHLDVTIDFTVLSE